MAPKASASAGKGGRGNTGMSGADLRSQGKVDKAIKKFKFSEVTTAPTSSSHSSTRPPRLTRDRLNLHECKADGDDTGNNIRHSSATKRARGLAKGSCGDEESPGFCGSDDDDEQTGGSIKRTKGIDFDDAKSVHSDGQLDQRPPPLQLLFVFWGLGPRALTTTRNLIGCVARVSSHKQTILNVMVPMWGGSAMIHWAHICFDKDCGSLCESKALEGILSIRVWGWGVVEGPQQHWGVQGVL